MKNLKQAQSCLWILNVHKMSCITEEPNLRGLHAKSDNQTKGGTKHYYNKKVSWLIALIRKECGGFPLHYDVIESNNHVYSNVKAFHWKLKLFQWLWKGQCVYYSIFLICLQLKYWYRKSKQHNWRTAVNHHPAIFIRLNASF